jgi:hypothetical protein
MQLKAAASLHSYFGSGIKHKCNCDPTAAELKQIYKNCEKLSIEKPIYGVVGELQDDNQQLLHFQTRMGLVV